MYTFNSRIFIFKYTTLKNKILLGIIEEKKCYLLNSDKKIKCQK